jgi:hypothetical protein
MRRTIITAVATLALAVPDVALASHQDEQQRGEQRRGGNEQHQSRFDCHAAVGGATRENARERDEDDDRFDDRGHDGQSNSGPGNGRQGALSGRDGHDNDGRDDDAEDEVEHCTSTASKVRSF